MDVVTRSGLKLRYLNQSKRHEGWNGELQQKKLSLAELGVTGELVMEQPELDPADTDVMPEVVGVKKLMINGQPGTMTIRRMTVEAYQKALMKSGKKPVPVTTTTQLPARKRPKLDVSAVEKHQLRKTLNMLQNHGIAIQPADNDNTVSTAVNGGQSVKLTEAGKQALSISKEIVPFMSEGLEGGGDKNTSLGRLVSSRTLETIPTNNGLEGGAVKTSSLGRLVSRTLETIPTFEGMQGHGAKTTSLGRLVSRPLETNGTKVFTIRAEQLITMTRQKKVVIQVPGSAFSAVQKSAGLKQFLAQLDDSAKATPPNTITPTTATPASTAISTATTTTVAVLAREGSTDDGAKATVTPCKQDYEMLQEELSRVKREAELYKQQLEKKEREAEEYKLRWKLVMLEQGKQVM